MTITCGLDKIGRRLPNFLTYLRVLMVPFFVFCLVQPTKESSIWATVIFVAASLTDWLDGYLARVYDAHSDIGKMLDPLADKILVMAALVMLSAAPNPRVSGWMTVVLLSREMLVTGLRSVAALKGIVVPASRVAKQKTFWTMVAIAFLLPDSSFRIDSWGLNTILIGTVEVSFSVIGTCLLWVALVLSVVSGIAYAVNLKDVFSPD